MAFTAKNLVNNELTASFVTQYTVPALTVTRVTEIIACNNAGATRTITLCFVETGETADDGAGAGTNAIMKAFNLPAGVPIIIPMNSFLEAGDFISAKASGVDVTLHISGIEDA